MSIPQLNDTQGTKASLFRTSKLNPALVLLSAGICFSHIHQGTLAVDAVKYAAIAHRILETGVWYPLVDPYSETIYLNKPPGLFWLLAVVFKTIGFSTFSAKLVPAVFAFIALILLFQVCRQVFGENTGYVAVILLAFNRTFTRDVLELGFDSLALLAGVICLKVLVEEVLEENPRTSRWFFFGIACFLLLQSKPPYLLFVLFPAFILIVFGRHWEKMLSLPASILSLLIPTLLGCWWLFVLSPEHFSLVFDNQAIEPMRVPQGFFQNSLKWLKAVFISFAPVSYLGLLAALSYLLQMISRKKEDGFRVQDLLISWLIPAIFVICLVEARPRYLLLPALALVLFACSSLAGRLSLLDRSMIAKLATGIGVACFLIFSLVGVRVHRANPLVESVYLKPNLLSDEIWFCVDKGRPDRSSRRARLSQILMRMEFGRKLEIFPSQTFLEKAFHSGQKALLEHGCENLLKKMEKPYKVLEKLPRTTLIELSDN